MAPEGLSRLAKAPGVEPPGQMRDEQLHAVAVRSTVASEKAKTPHVRITFGRSDVVRCGRCKGFCAS